MKIRVCGKLLIEKIPEDNTEKEESLFLKSGMGGDEHIWIELDSGEGGDFSGKDFFDLVLKFYKDNF